MNTEKIIDNYLFDVGYEFIQQRKKNRILPILIIIVGLAIAIVSDATLFKYNFSNIVQMLGYMIGITGLVLLIISFNNKGVPYYSKTGKNLRRYEYTFGQKQRDKIIGYINEGNLKLLEDMPNENSASVKVIVYKTPEEDLALMQALEYIPHTYQPITDIKVLQKV